MIFRFKKMGIGLSEIGTRIGTVAVSTIRGCRNHPFIVGHLCFFFITFTAFLWLSPPYKSPLLMICTAVFILLGTLFYFRLTEPLPVITRAAGDAAVVVAGAGSKNKDIWEDTVGETSDDDAERSSSDSFDSKTATVNSPNFPHSPGGEDGEEDVVSDSASEGGESSSSSPDASVPGVMPIIDELNPLLDEDSSNPIHMSRVGSDGNSEESSPMSRTSSCDSADDIVENHEDGGGEEEESKSAIIWTEEDQKNLMDLGSSEIERNQRLEHLILRRRRRKNLSMVPEINLMEFEDPNFFPPHVGPISTARRNPFDDSYDNSNIPGSAPSVLLQRRNPFDSPCGPEQEWSSDPIGDGFQEGFAPFFKGQKSLNVGPSLFAPNAKMRPFFLPERAVAEEPSFPPFDCKSSEMSDSQTSSVPETESVGSVEELEEERKLPEEDMMSRAEEVMQDDQSEDQETIIAKNEFYEAEGVTQDPQLILEMNHVTEHIGHGSQSSSDEEEGSLESGDMNITSISGDNIPHMVPIYDSSPPIFRKNLSSSSCGSSELHGESHMTLPPVLVKRAVSFAKRDSENRLIEEVIVGRTQEKCLMVDGVESTTSPDLLDSDGDDFQEATGKLVTTPAVGGSTSMFYNVAMHGRIFENLEEVQVPNTPVESVEKMQTIQNLNIPVIYELDKETPSPSLGSPFSPDFISMPSSLDINVQTIQEEADGIKEIDEGISSDLDSIRDFSVTRSSSGSIELEEHVRDSIGEASRTSDAVKVNGTEHETISVNPRDEIDVSNHDYQNNFSRRNEVDMHSVENVDDGSLIKDVALDYDQASSTQTSEYHVGETTPSERNRDDGGSGEVEVKNHEDLGRSTPAKERADTSERESDIE